MPESTLPARIAAVEAGGTKFVCAVMAGSRPELLAQTELPTGDDPADCLRRVGAWFDQQIRTLGPVDALGVATFGPADIDPQSNGYGTITSTPKPGWAQAPLLAPLQQALGGVPAGFDTDVNGAALGEHLFGAARGLEDFVYVTMGTGIGGGGMARGRLLHGLVHPEMGHLRIPRASGDDFPGACPYHGDCWEGLCSGPALEARAGRAAADIPADDPVWRLAARDTGLALANIVCTLSPRRIVIGGSVRKAGALGQSQFFALVRRELQQALHEYVASPSLVGDAIEQYVVPPGLGDAAGITGAWALGRRAWEAAHA